MKLTRGPLCALLKLRLAVFLFNPPGEYLRLNQTEVVYTSKL